LDDDFFDRLFRLSDEELLELVLELLELLLLLELELELEEELLSLSDSESLEEEDEDDEEEDDIFLLRLFFCFLSTTAGTCSLNVVVLDTAMDFAEARRATGGLGDLVHTDTFLIAVNLTLSLHSRSDSSCVRGNSSIALGFGP
jgi:hypothetical protein